MGWVESEGWCAGVCIPREEVRKRKELELNEQLDGSKPAVPP